MRIITLLVFTLITSCAVKKVPLKSLDADAGNLIKFHVNFLKAKTNTMDISASAIAKDGDVVIKKEEIECGKGDEVGTVLKLQHVREPYLFISRSFKEFVVVCENRNFVNVEGDFYLKFKNIHALEQGMPGKVLASDVKVVFQ